MNNYNFAELVKRKRPHGGRALLPSIHVPIAFERSLLVQLRKVEQEVARGIRDIILPAFIRKALQLKDGLTTDADEGSMDALSLIVNAMVKAASIQVTQLLELEGKRHTSQFMASARQAFGIDLSSVIAAEDLGGYLEMAALRNASLIKSLGDDMVKRVGQETTSALIGGESARELQARLKKQLEISDSRARLIARDQTSKLTSDLNQIRQKQAGVESYIWRTSQDERVRPRHAALEGKQYTYGEPTGAENGLPPGQPVQCRCIAQGVVVF